MGRSMRAGMAALGLGLGLGLASAPAQAGDGERLGQALGILFGQAKPQPASEAPTQGQQALASPPPQRPLTEKERRELEESQAKGNLANALLMGRMTPAQERELGRQIAGGVLGAAPLVPDFRLQSYVNRVGMWVALQSERPEVPWRFGVIESEGINAFAAPGGYILVTKGLYRLLRTESQLAGVLGHEIAHVNRRHHEKLLRKSSAIAGLSGLLAARVGGGGGGEQELRAVIGNGAEIMARGLDKDSELEADRDGSVYAARAGYEPYGLAAILEEMGHFGAGDSRMGLLKKTHPDAGARLESLSAAVGDRWEGLAGGKELSGRLVPLRD